jgi:ankyrin repeat protein
MMTETLSGDEFLAAAARGDSDAIKAALAAGANADTQDAYGNTALMMAAARGQREVCRALIEAGANTAHKNKYGLGPRNWADWDEDGAHIRAMLG